MAEQHEYAERMFPEPVDLGIAQPDRAVSSVTHGTRSYLEGEGGEGGAWYEGGGAASDVAVQGITVYPPTGGVQTQGDAWEPVKIGVLIDMDLNQLLADWIDPTILAIEDALNEGIFTRGPVQLVIADARGLHRVDGRPQVRVRVLLHRRQRRHPHRGHDVRPVAAPAWPAQGRPVLGAGLVGPRLRRLLPRDRAAARPDHHPGGQARAQPAQPRRRPGRHARRRHRGPLLRRLRVRHVSLRRGPPGARLGPPPGHGHPVPVL